MIFNRAPKASPKQKKKPVTVKKEKKIVPSSQPPAPTAAVKPRLASGSSAIPTVPSPKPNRWSPPMTSGASSQALSSKQSSPSLQSSVNQQQNPSIPPASSSSSKATAKSQATSSQPVSKPSTRSKVTHHPSLQASSSETSKPAPQMYLSESEYPVSIYNH